MPTTLITDVITGAAAGKFNLGEALRTTDAKPSDIAELGFTADSKAMDEPTFKAAVENYAKDAGLSLGDANIDALGWYFLHIFEPQINALYRGRDAVRIFGTVQMGDWLTTAVVFKHRELTAGVGLYDDWSRPFLAGYNYGYDTRDTVRFEFGKEVTKLEEAIAAKMRRNADRDKMDAIVLKDSIVIDDTFFYGVNFDGKRIYGIQNEPGISARVTNLDIDPANSNVTAEQMVTMLGRVKQNLIDDLQGNGDINSMSIKLVVPNKWQTAFTRANVVTGYTAMRWLAENWKNAKLEFSVKADTLDDGEPKMMVFAETVPDVGANSLMLITTSKLRLVGAMPSLKGREECYSSSVAGAMAACPVAIRFYVGSGESDSDSDSDSDSI